MTSREPRRQDIWRWRSKWAALIACALVAFAFLASLRWAMLAQRFDMPAAHQVGILRGVVMMWFDDDSGSSDPSQMPWQFTLVRHNGKLVWTPAFDRNRRLFIVLPLWIPLAILLLPTAGLFWLDRRRPQPGQCVRCGYDLSGLPDAPCPECGATQVENDAR